MADTHVTLVGNLTDDPELRYTQSGVAVSSFRLAVSSRVKEGDTWRDGETHFYTVSVWRDMAEHVGDSLSKGDRTMVIGRLKTRSWETPEGQRRTVVEVDAEEVGPSLKWATATVSRVRRDGSKAPAGAPTAPSGGWNDEPPF